jgi:CRISPR-associated protein Cas1
MEGARVKRLCELHAHENAVNCRRRDHDPANWSGPDTPNRCLNAATTCLYGLAEAAILAPGQAPAIGLIHAGKPQSFAYDVADVYKLETVVPIAFEIAGRAGGASSGGSRPS